MTLFRRALVAVLAILTILPFTVSQAHAAPKAATANATVQRNTDNVVIRIANGSMAVEDGYLLVRNDAGKTVDKFNLTFVAPNKAEHDVAAAVNGRTAILTPNKVAKRKPGQIVCGPQTRAQRDQEALTTMATEMGVAVTIGTLVGTGIGAILALTTLGALGIAIPIGALVGVALGLGGAAISGTFTRYFQTVNSPFKLKFC
ncbi:MAG: hypothetical protein WAW85_01180 [Gordonia sp. (in: high G+C Gram-positive bacteria)]|uniref:hypothetical protein n=1 Tax=Gordonia sp. (in: high G+C Gram-positive bacteria) TaxID=84139 RepID=UPI003BB512BE